MGIGGLGPQDGVKIIEHDNINYQFSNNGLWFMCLLQTTRSFFFEKSVSCISNNISSAWSGWRSTYTSFKWSRLFRVMRCKLQNPGTFLGCFQLLGTTNDLQCRRECYLLLASKVERVWHLLDTKFAAAKTSEEEQARSTYTVYTRTLCSCR